MRFSRFISGLAVAMAFVAGTASAELIYTLTDKGTNNIDVTLSGSLDLNAVTFQVHRGFLWVTA